MRKTHGLSGSRFYYTYTHMVGRCKSDKGRQVPHYKGKGLTCDWPTFESFMDDMYESYLKHIDEFGTKDTTIERIDNDKGYSKENCKWETRRVQSIHRDVPNGTSKYRGVRLFRKPSVWRAQIQNDGKKYHSGLFKTEVEAAKAYNTLALELHGTDAMLNVIPEEAYVN